MNLALAHYSKADSSNIEEIEASIITVRDHLDLLNRLFHTFDNCSPTSALPIDRDEVYKNFRTGPELQEASSGLILLLIMVIRQNHP